MKYVKYILSSFRDYIRKSFIVAVVIIATTVHYITIEKGKEKIVTVKKIKRIKFFNMAKRILFFKLPFLCKYLCIYDELNELNKKEWK